METQTAEQKTIEDNVTSGRGYGNRCEPIKQLFEIKSETSLDYLKRALMMMEHTDGKISTTNFNNNVTLLRIIDSKPVTDPRVLKTGSKTPYADLYGGNNRRVKQEIIYH